MQNGEGAVRYLHYVRGLLSVLALAIALTVGAVEAQDNSQAMELAFWQSIAESEDPADFRAYLDQWPNGTFAPLARNKLKRIGGTQPTVVPAPKGYHTPARGTTERKAIMNAARIPISRAIGQKVIFVVDIVRSDGTWAYLQAVPHKPGGAPIDWRKTPFAQDWKADMMSDVVMVLLRNDGGGWRAVDHVVGPTDVYWYGWVDQYGLPEALFLQQ